MRSRRKASDWALVALGIVFAVVVGVTYMIAAAARRARQVARRAARLVVGEGRP